MYNKLNKAIDRHSGGMLQTSCGNFRPAQKLPKMAISGLLIIYEQQKVATSSNFSIAHDLIWQFLSRPLPN